MSVAQTLKTFRLLTLRSTRSSLFRLAKSSALAHGTQLTLAMDAIGKKSVFRMSCRCVYAGKEPASTRRKAILDAVKDGTLVLRSDMTKSYEMMAKSLDDDFAIC